MTKGSNHPFDGSDIHEYNLYVEYLETELEEQKRKTSGYFWLLMLFFPWCMILLIGSNLKG